MNTCRCIPLRRSIPTGHSRRDLENAPRAMGQSEGGLVDLPVPASAAPGRDTGSAICPGSARGDLPRSVDIACPILAWSPIAACTDDLADPKRTRLQEFREIAAVLDQPAWASLDWCSGMKALSCPVMRLS